MRNILLFIVITFVVLSSCNRKQQQPENDQYEKVERFVNEEVTDTLSAKEQEEYAAFYETYFKNFSYEGIKVFQPMTYNETDFNKQLFHIMDTIVGLFKERDRYILKPCRIEKVNTYENECYGGDMLEPTLDTKGDCRYLFRGLKKYSEKEILDTVAARFSLFPGEERNFTFNNVSYKLKGEGRAHRNIASTSWDSLIEYKLILTDGDKTQCITEMKKFSDTRTEVVFIGDLDGDGKPDFIISSPDWYEDYRILLLLSSFAEYNEQVKLVSITMDSFAC